jgi:hypothetical protein
MANHAELELATMLQVMGIAEQPSTAYASSLVEDGFDTAEAFDSLSLEELAEDFNMKRGHLRMVEKSRAPAPRPVPRPAAPCPALSPAPEGIPPSAQPVVRSTPPARMLNAGRTIFGSMRFPAPPEAMMLQAALAENSVDLQILDLSGGADITKQVFEGIRAADAFMVFGTKHYGEDTGNPACTYHELKYAQHKGKVVIPLRMIPWGEEFDHICADVLFGANMLTLSWQCGQPMPAMIVPEVIRALPKLFASPSTDVALRRVSSAPPSPVQDAPSSVAVTSSMQLIDTLSKFAGVCDTTVDELVSMFSPQDIKELMGEKEGQGIRIGILGRKRVLAEFSQLLEVAPSALVPVEEEPLIMLIGDEEQRLILCFLPPPSIAAMALVSRHWSTLTSDDFFWEKKCQIDLGWEGLPSMVPSFRQGYRSMTMFRTLPGLCCEVLDT